MPCDEYKKLDLLHQYAIERILRFAKPDAEPRIVIPTGNQLTKRLDEARAEETEARLAIHEHIKRCKECDQPTNGEQALILE
jgi:hypothetical protein